MTTKYADLREFNSMTKEGGSESVAEFNMRNVIIKEKETIFRNAN